MPKLFLNPHSSCMLAFQAVVCSEALTAYGPLDVLTKGTRDNVSFFVLFSSVGSKRLTACDKVCAGGAEVGTGGAGGPAKPHHSHPISIGVKPNKRKIITPDGTIPLITGTASTPTPTPGTTRKLPHRPTVPFV